MTTALIDGDILLYECGFAGEYKDEETGEKAPKNFEDVKEILDQRILEICEAVEATERPLIFLTGDERLLKSVNKERSRRGEEALPWKPNFRFEVAKSRPYKERTSTKPYHYHNLRAYLRSRYKVRIAWGMEADDLLSIHQVLSGCGQDTVICSRDKDLRIVPGLHYGWECGLQAEFGPELVDELGYLNEPTKSGLKGVGLKFFYAQMIMGDGTDTIPGLPGGGKALAYKSLKDCGSEEELYETTAELYRKKIGDSWADYFQEQASLLWMVQQLDEEGNPILYVPPVHRQVP